MFSSVALVSKALARALSQGPRDLPAAVIVAWSTLAVAGLCGVPSALRRKASSKDRAAPRAEGAGPYAPSASIVSLWRSSGGSTGGRMTAASTVATMSRAAAMKNALLKLPK
jgi:hypothetical protein